MNFIQEIEDRLVVMVMFALVFVLGAATGVIGTLICISATRITR